MPPAPPRARAEPLPRLGLILLVALTLMWGLNWPLMKIALNALPPFTFRGMMVPAAGVLLLALARTIGQELRMPRAIWRPLAVSALLNVAGWHALSALGVSHMSSGRAVVIAYTMPLWTALAARLFLGERLTGRRVLALALGTGGLAALLGGDLAGLSADPWGPIYALGAAVVWAGGTLIQKQVVWRVPILALTGWQLVVGGVPIVAFALALESPSLAAFTPPVIAVIAYNVLGSLCFCYYAWYKIVSLFPATIAALSTLMIPVIGVISGTLILGEPLGWREISALVLVCSAIGLVVTPSSPSRAAPD